MISSLRIRFEPWRTGFCSFWISFSNYRNYLFKPQTTVFSYAFIYTDKSSFSFRIKRSTQKSLSLRTVRESLVCETETAPNNHDGRHGQKSFFKRPMSRGVSHPLYYWYSNIHLLNWLWKLSFRHCQWSFNLLNNFQITVTFTVSLPVKTSELKLILSFRPLESC